MPEFRFGHPVDMRDGAEMWRVDDNGLVQLQLTRLDMVYMRWTS